MASPRTVERKLSWILKPRWDGGPAIQYRQQHFLELLNLTRKVPEAVDALRRLSTEPFARDDRRRWADGLGWKKLMNRLEKLQAKSVIPADLAEIYRTEHTTHQERIERVGELTRRWAEADPENQVLEDFAGAPAHAATVLDGDEELDWAAVVPQVAAEGYGGSKKGELVRVEMIATGRRLTVAKFYQGLRGGLVTIGFTSNVGLAAVPYEDLRAHHDQRKTEYRIDWKPGIGSESAEWEAIPDRALHLPIGPENHDLLMRLGRRLPDLPQER